MAADPDGGGSQPPPQPPPDGDPTAPPAEGGGLLGSLSALAGQSGTADERLGAERDAISGLSVGQVVGGNVYNMVAGSAAVRMYHLSTEDLYESREAFVRTVAYGTLSRDVGTRVVTLLRGPAGSGKYALARALLLGAGHQALYLLAPDTDLTRISGSDLRRGAGYVLADLPHGAVGALTLFDVNRLETQLRSQDCRLIVTLGSSTAPGDAQVLPYLLEVTEQPPGGEVAASHLGWRLGIGRASLAQRLLARSDVARLRTELLDGAPASRAAELGRLLAEAAGTGTEDEVVQKVRDRLELRDGQSLARWFESQSDLARQCLAIGVAAFGGEAYESVAPLSYDLEERLQVEESAENPDRRRGTALTGSRSGRLTAIHATLVESEVATRHGGARGQVVRYRDQGVAVKVLEHVWSEYDRMRLVLPNWLRDCAVNELPTVRVRAAVAAGTLAKQSFETVRAQILSPWAADERPELRDAAAIAVRVAAVESGHARAAHDLVRGWSFDGNPRLRATAARSWRVIFELDGTEAAWALLHDLANTEEAAVIDAVCRSLTEYMALEKGRYYRDALDLIDQWVRSGSHGPRRSLVGEVAFLYAAADLVDHIPAVAGGSGEWIRPTLLTAADLDSRRREEVALLWMKVVNSPDVYEAAHDILAEWARLVESDPQGRAALGRLLRVASTDRRTQLIIRKQAENWMAATGGRGASLAGQDVLIHLGDRRTAP